MTERWTRTPVLEPMQALAQSILSLPVDHAPQDDPLPPVTFGAEWDDYWNRQRYTLEGRGTKVDLLDRSTVRGVWLSSPYHLRIVHSQPGLIVGRQHEVEAAFSLVGKEVLDFGVERQTTILGRRREPYRLSGDRRTVVAGWLVHHAQSLVGEHLARAKVAAA